VLGTTALAAPAAPSGVLDPLKSNSAGTQGSGSAHFTPAVKGQKTVLQALTIVTTATDEVKKASWRTIDTGKQDAKGNTTFAVDHPLEGRRRSGAGTPPGGGGPATISNEVTFAAAKTTKNTGLSPVYL